MDICYGGISKLAEMSFGLMGFIFTKVSCMIKSNLCCLLLPLVRKLESFPEYVGPLLCKASQVTLNPLLLLLILEKLNLIGFVFVTPTFPLF